MMRIRIFIVALIAFLALIVAGCNSKTSLDKEKETSTSTEEKNEEQVEKVEEVEGENFYFTANEGGSINKIRVTDNQVVSTIEVEGAVHNIQTSPDGKMFAVTVVPAMEEGHGGHADVPGKVLFYDSVTNDLQQTVEVGNHPAHIVYTHDGKYALVTNNEDNTVSMIDLGTYKVINIISTGNGPHGFRITKDDRYAYVANMGEDTISVINIEEKKEEKRIVVGGTPVTTGITSDGKTIVVTLNTENKLAIVDIDTEKITKVDVGYGPAQVYIDANDQYAYVANQGTEERPSNSVSVTDLKEKKVVSTIETGKGSHGVVTSPDNKYAYVTNMFENTVSVIDLTSNAVVATIQVGATPNGISIME